MAKTQRAISPATQAALRLLGLQIAVARRERRWTLVELAERVGVTVPTLRRVESGDPSVGIGVAFETATVLGIPLFHQDGDRRRVETRRLDDRLAALPQAVRSSRTVNDDF